MFIVLHRQAKVNNIQPKIISVASVEPVPGPRTSNPSQGSKNTSRGYYKAKMNVIRTMIFILVCFVICLFPVDFYALYSTLTVFILRTFWSLHIK